MPFRDGFVVFVIYCCVQGGNANFQEGIKDAITTQDHKAVNNGALYRRNSEDYHNKNPENFDGLIFSQSWPISECLVWKHQHKGENCRQLNGNLEWTIHGIWPTKWGTTGPSYCDRTKPFKIDEIKDLVKQMEQQWPTIEAGGNENEFWKHEWEKHGTCALQLSELDNEHKYFLKGLELNKRYNLKYMLSYAGIDTGRSYPRNHLIKVIRDLIQVTPEIVCYHNKVDNKDYLEEIRLCFNKQLSLINCVESKSVNDHGCKSSSIVYPEEPIELLEFM